MIRRAVAVLIFTMLLAGSGAAAASARNPNVIQAIRAQDAIIHANRTFRNLSTAQITNRAQTRATIPKFRALARLADTAAMAVSRASATRTQRRGQHDWVIGVRDVARGVDGLALALQDVLRHHRGRAHMDSVRAKRMIDAGNAIGARGDRLLHLPSSD